MKTKQRNVKSIYDTVNCSEILQTYYALVDAGKQEEADEILKEKLPVPRHLSEASILAYGKDVYVEMGFKIIERNM